MLNGVLLVGLSESRRHSGPPQPPAEGRGKDSSRAKLRVAAPAAAAVAMAGCCAALLV
ncbi:MAG TPA: hypothetical protein VFX21_05535 [Acidimicrobiia bacterium]|nr:hypothetical protein [Acidimicrobiia bacterium]